MKIEIDDITLDRLTRIAEDMAEYEDTGLGYGEGGYTEDLKVSNWPEIVQAVVKGLFTKPH